MVISTNTKESVREESPGGKESTLGTKPYTASKIVFDLSLVK
jgi:hypothetical protein